MKMSDFSELVSFTKDRDAQTTETRYFTQHYSKSTRFNGRRGSILNQELVIKGDLRYPYFEASMEMKDFPRCSSEREAALKLAEWMQRMGAAIENYWSEP
ncbi:hypothetical protein ESA_03071 [Cronobacter sakazakii ATCC BAA-894]|uniref:Uncharacterized protein n=2 Tax=Enterobacteriaceae TaxID=543 RepID=A7MI77_CROS8|nr:hypothetical protein ESA_03071 [Cronobacter sakazakii ATCC BAA-894]